MVCIRMEGPPIEFSTGYVNIRQVFLNAVIFKFTQSNYFPSKFTCAVELLNCRISPEWKNLIGNCYCNKKKRFMNAVQ